MRTFIRVHIDYLTVRHVSSGLLI